MQDSRETPEPGQILAGKYRVEKIIGEGAMGYVLGAYHLELEERVAIKWVRDIGSASPEAIERFLREAKLCAKIQSEHVVRVRDVGRNEKGAPFIVMELLDGRDLASVVDTHKRVAPPTAVDYVLQALEAVAEAHSMGIVHRDLKLQNLFLARRKDGSELVKVLDFGISKVTNASQAMTMGTAILGSPLYMSPEQMRSSRDVDARSDIWSMGVVLYELLTGTVPFMAESLPELCMQVMNAEPTAPSALVKEISPGLEGVLLSCLAKSPSDRPAHVGILAQALAPFATPQSRPSVDRIARILPITPQDPPLRAPMSSSRLAVPIQARTLAITPDRPSGPLTGSGGPASGIGAAQSQTTPNWAASQSSTTSSKGPNKALFAVPAVAVVVMAAIGFVGWKSRATPDGSTTPLSTASATSNASSTASNASVEATGSTTQTKSEPEPPKTTVVDPTHDEIAADAGSAPVHDGHSASAKPATPTTKKPAVTKADPPKTQPTTPQSSTAPALGDGRH